MAAEQPIRTYRYKAFLSYSHAADGNLSPRLQSALQRFAKPWYRLWAMRVFRDETGLGVTPELWPTIQRALGESEYFILLASPQAAGSKWVEQEVGYWLKERSTGNLLIIWTDGRINLPAGEADFDWNTTNSLPPQLKNAFKGEPLYLDLCWAKQDTDLSIRNPKFLEATARLTSVLLGLPLDRIIGEHVREFRRTRRWAISALTALTILTVAALSGAGVALQQRNLAKGQQKIAEKRRQEAVLQRGLVLCNTIHFAY